MKVLVISKTSFDVTQYNAVSSITYSSGNYVIINNGVSHTFSAANYIINILVQEG